METPHFWITGYLPNGMKASCYIPFTDVGNAFAEMLTFTNGLLQAGFLMSEPGLEAGEQRETINVLSRRNKTNDDGTKTPVLDLYVNNDKMKHRFLAVYLNTPEDIAAFETASEVNLESIPLNPTTAPVDRDVTEFTLKVKPFNVVFKNNPNYDEANEAKKPKRLFVRWDGITKVLPLDTAAGNGTQSSQEAQKNGATPETPTTPASAAKQALAGNGHDKPRRMGASQWTAFRNDLLYNLGQVASQFAFEERGNTVNKMYEEGAFDGIEINEAIKMVMVRLNSHRKEKTS